MIRVALAPVRRTSAFPMPGTAAGASGDQSDFDQYSRFGSRKTTGSSLAIDARSSP